MDDCSGCGLPQPPASKAQPRLRGRVQFGLVVKDHVAREEEMGEDAGKGSPEYTELYLRSCH